MPRSTPPPPPRFDDHPAPGRRARPLERLLGAAIAVVLLAGAVSAIVRGTGDDGPRHPEAWDPRVVDLVRFVERDRGLSFDHPVYVDFLTPEEYTGATTDDVSDLDEDVRDELAEQAGLLRALGVASGEVDLAAALNDVSDSGTLAFYDPSSKRVRVRGTEMTVGLRSTLVHELTHALQDQHFDLKELLSGSEDGGEYAGRRALAEGDASRVADDYVRNELTDEEEAAYDAEIQAEVDKSQEGTKDVPDFINLSFGIYYVFGPPFLRMLLNDGGNSAVDHAFDHPPSTEEHLFDPASYLADETWTRAELDLDPDVVPDGPFGISSWYLVLAARLDPAVAMKAALGWNGDDYASFDRDGTTCVRAVFRGDTPQDEQQMSAALDGWIAAMPAGAAHRVDVEGHPGFESCDPGPGVDIPIPNDLTDAVLLPQYRGYAEAAVAKDLKARGSRCFADRVVDGLTVAQLADRSDAGRAALDARFQARGRQAFGACESLDT